MVVPNDALLIVLPVADKQSLVWGGIEMATGEILTYGPGDKLHTWTHGRCRWRMIVSSADDLATYARAVRGDQFISAPARWRPRRATLRPLLQLHRTAIRAAETHSGALADLGASHGLEQQVIHALIECLASGTVAAETPVEHCHRELVTQFEELLSTRPVSDLSDYCAALGVSQRLLRSCCYKHLGMDPVRYECLRRDG